MATSNEQKALLFLAAAALLAAGVRLARAREPGPEAGPRAQAELAAQVRAADSLRLARATRQTRGGAAGRGAAAARRALDQPVRERIDVDTAPAELLMRLPGIGPAIAARIVDDRIAHGSFGSLAALGQVRGIGPATLRRLDSLVTFSGPPRPAPPPPAPGGSRIRTGRVAGGR